ncbi:unnamed protein product [Peniophora sp. CBMAI 1063]|nr:unnamed protein product [Peniophora sp. CBMAI 1063]
MAALPKHHANRSRTLFCNPSLSSTGTSSQSGGRSGSRTPSLFSARSRRPSRVRTDPTNGESSDPCVDQGDDDYQASQQSENGWGWNFNLQLPYIPLAWAREHTDTSKIRSVQVVTPSFLPDGDRDSIKATWLGHASYLVSLPTGGKPIRVLFDPIHSQRAGPTQFTGVKRRLPAPCAVDDLPEFEFVVISHNHYDHLDLGTHQRIRADLRRQNVRYLVPIGVKAFFTSAPLNVPSSQVYEMDWWETLSLPADAHADEPVLQGEPDGLARDRRYANFTCTPAQHNSGRGVLDSRTTLWASWVVETRMRPVEQDDTSARRVAVYFAGDTGLMTPNGPCTIFDEIGDRLGPFDLALLPIWRGGSLSFVSRLGLRIEHEHPSTTALTSLHATPAHALRMHLSLRSSHSLAMHFATFSGNENEARDACVELFEAREAWNAVLRGDVEDESGVNGVFGGADTGSDHRKAGDKEKDLLSPEAANGMSILGGDIVADVEDKRKVGEWWESGGFGWIDIGCTAIIPLDERSPREVAGSKLQY